MATSNPTDELKSKKHTDKNRRIKKCISENKYPIMNYRSQT